MTRIQSSTGNPFNQIRIKLEDLDIRVDEEREGLIKSFSVKVDLSSYDLPKDGIVKIVLNAKKWQKIIPLGTVENTKELTNRKVPQIAGIECTVFVTEKDDPLIIAKSKPMKLSVAAGDEGNVSGILPMQPDPELKDLLWRLSFDPSTGAPTLLYNVSDELDVKAHIQNDKCVQAYIIPSIVTQILIKLAKNFDDEEEWVIDWKNWLSHCGEEMPEDRNDDNAVEEWVLSVVQDFAKRQKWIEFIVFDLRNDSNV